MFDAEDDEVDDLDSTSRHSDIDGGDHDGDSIERNDRTNSLSSGTTAEKVVSGDEEVETVEVLHPVARGDSLLAIARRYATDVSLHSGLDRSLADVCSPTSFSN